MLSQKEKNVDDKIELMLEQIQNEMIEKESADEIEMGRGRKE